MKRLVLVLGLVLGAVFGGAVYASASGFGMWEPEWLAEEPPPSAQPLDPDAGVRILSDYQAAFYPRDVSIVWSWIGPDIVSDNLAGQNRHVAWTHTFTEDTALLGVNVRMEHMKVGRMRPGEYESLLLYIQEPTVGVTSGENEGMPSTCFSDYNEAHRCQMYWQEHRRWDAGFASMGSGGSGGPVVVNEQYQSSNHFVKRLFPAGSSIQIILDGETNNRGNMSTQWAVVYLALTLGAR